MGKPWWSLQLTKDSLHRLGCSRRPPSPRPPLTSLSHPAPSMQPAPLGPHVPCPPPLHSGNSTPPPQREVLSPQTLPQPFRLAPQPSARCPVVALQRGGGLGNGEGAFGSAPVTGHPIWHPVPQGGQDTLVPSQMPRIPRRITRVRGEQRGKPEPRLLPADLLTGLPTKPACN